MSKRGILPVGAPGQLGVELGVVPPSPVVSLLLWLLLLGRPCPTSDTGQQGLRPCPLSRFPLETVSPELIQGWGSGREEAGWKAGSPRRHKHPPTGSYYLAPTPSCDKFLALHMKP